VVIGREHERARIDALLEAGRRGRTGTLVVAGEPGIGKTALLEDACERAAGLRVLKVTAAEAESSLPFAGLHALLQPLSDLFSRLEEPQERSLRIALALAEGGEPEVLAVNAGALTVLAEAASKRPLLVAVDDAHWLDAPSADALAFAARRLEGEELVFLFGIRTGESSAFDGFPRLELQPLAREDSRALLGRRREQVPAAAVERMLDIAGGNPLAVLELPVALASDGPEEDVTASDRLRGAFAARLDSLGEPSRRALMLAAAEPDPGAVRRAAESLRLGREALAPAETAGLVRLEPNGVVFRHPLVRSLAYASVGPVERRAAHRALAQALPDDADRDRRAWHLAAAATEPDEELALMLEETADRAEARGGHGAAARALERAARLSVDRDAFARRLTRAARLASWAGEVDRALAMSEEALQATQDANLRADVLLEIASVRGAQGVGYAQEQFFETIAEREELDPDRSARLLLTLVTARGNLYDTRRAVELAERLEASARRAGEWWRPRGLAVAATAHLAAGDGARFSSLFGEIGDHDASVASCALDLVWAERYAEARRALETTLREGRASGNQMRVIWNQACLAHLELRLGRLPQALAAAAEAIALADAHGMGAYAGIARSALAGIQAWRGDVETCRASAAEALAAAREAWSVSDELNARTALGLLWLGLGRTDEVVDELAPCARRWFDTEHVEPSGVPFVPDLVEAYGRRDEPEAARELLARFRAVSEQTGRQWALAAVARCEGMLAAADDFARPFERSLELLTGSQLTLDRARTQLLYGERLRRAGRRREARTQLRAAHEAFAAVDAAPWAERAAAELRATGETVGPRTPDRRGELTPQELQIAALVGEGRTNKEIAAQLYLSPKTIEYHLANAYRKLGVHSRVELARVVAEQA
jgi:DNA-binding CsgD family transcriptional regulator